MLTLIILVCVIVCVNLWVICAWLTYDAAKDADTKIWDGPDHVVMGALAFILGPAPLMVVLYGTYIIQPIKRWLNKPRRKT